MLAVDEKKRTFGDATRAIRWRLLVFDYSGKSYRGATIFDRKEQADKRIYELTQRKKCEPNGWYITTLEGDVAAPDFNYAIPMPVVE